MLLMSSHLMRQFRALQCINRLYIKSIHTIGECQCETNYCSDWETVSETPERNRQQKICASMKIDCPNFFIQSPSQCSLKQIDLCIQSECKIAECLFIHILWFGRVPSTTIDTCSIYTIIQPPPSVVKAR